MRISWLLFVVIMLFSTKGIGQEWNSKDTAEVYRLLSLAKNQENPDTAIRINQEALNRSIGVGYPDGAGTALLEIGLVFINQGEYKKGIDNFKKALPYCKKAIYHKELICSYYNDMAMAYYYHGDYEPATKYFLQALDEIKRADKTDGEFTAMIYNNLATIQYRLGQLSQAIVYWNEGEGMARTGGFDYPLSMILANEGSYYAESGQLDSAKKCLREALVVSKKIRNIYIQAGSNSSLGDVFIKAKQNETAIPYLKEAIFLSNKADIPSTSIVASYSLGEAYNNLKRFAEAELVLSNALRKAEKIDMKEDMIRGYSTLALTYKSLGNYSKALAAQEKIVMLKDSLFSTEKAKAINQMEIKYKTAEKDKQLAVNSLQLAQQESSLARKNLWIGGVSAGAVVLILLLIGLYRYDRHRQFAQAQHILTLQQEQEIGILKAMMHGEENERGRIARELHDGIGGMLSAAMMRFMSIRHKHTGLADTPEYEEVLTLLEDMGGEIRKTAHNLMPEVLLKQGLPEAVRAFCNHIQSNGLQIDAQFFGDFEELSHDFKLSTYRIVQELVQNVSKHAKATKVLVQLMRHEQVFSITIEDNGTGFDPEKMRSGIGLHNLQTRVHNQNGRFILESEEGKGTSVYIEFDVETGEVTKDDGEV